MPSSCRTSSVISRPLPSFSGFFSCSGPGENIRLFLYDLLIIHIICLIRNYSSRKLNMKGYRRYVMHSHVHVYVHYCCVASAALYWPLLQTCQMLMHMYRNKSVVSRISRLIARNVAIAINCETEADLYHVGMRLQGDIAVPWLSGS